MLSLPWHCPRAPDPHAHLNRKAVVRPCCFCYFGREGVVVGLARATLPICAGTPCRSVRRTQMYRFLIDPLDCPPSIVGLPRNLFPLSKHFWNHLSDGLRLVFFSSFFFGFARAVASCHLLCDGGMRGRFAGSTRRRNHLDLSCARMHKPPLTYTRNTCSSRTSDSLSEMPPPPSATHPSSSVRRHPRTRRFCGPHRHATPAYLRVSTNGYADTGASKPFVHLVGPPLYLALRRSRDGGRGKRARSGCWLNAEWGRLCDSGKDGVQGGEGGWRKWRNLKWDDQEEVGRSQEGNEHILGISRCAEIVIGWEWEMPTQWIGSARSLGMRGAFFCSLLHMVSYFP
ncbi:hypothetical protein DFH06DRAFT_52332 [Mycena polygramma]|nr:hypothetical protein DFH06DRAFT_52332 [Mycena polygramma]